MKPKKLLYRVGAVLILVFGLFGLYLVIAVGSSISQTEKIFLLLQSTFELWVAYLLYRERKLGIWLAIGIILLLIYHLVFDIYPQIPPEYKK